MMLHNATVTVNFFDQSQLLQLWNTFFSKVYVVSPLQKKGYDINRNLQKVSYNI